MKKSCRKLLGSAALCAGLVVAAPALADNVEFDQLVTPDVIFGSGNINGGFTTDRENGIELGLRAKIPFAGVLHSNGDGSYSYTLAETGPMDSRGRCNANPLRSCVHGIAFTSLRAIGTVATWSEH
jgi:hypothetical protein